VSAQPAGQIAFVTDDELARRLEQVENRLRDIAAGAGSAARELAALRELLSKP
jgi:hypothetical protein